MQILIPFLSWRHPQTCRPGVPYVKYRPCGAYLQSSTWGKSSSRKSCSTVTLHHLGALHTSARHCESTLFRAPQSSAAEQRSSASCEFRDATGRRADIQDNAESYPRRQAAPRMLGTECVRSPAAATDSWTRQNILGTPLFLAKYHCCNNICRQNMIKTTH